MNRRQFLALASAGAGHLAFIPAGCARMQDGLTQSEFMAADAVDIAQMVSSGRISAVEAVQAAIDMVNMYNEQTNAVVDFHPEAALRKAARMPQGEAPALWGVPTLIKDLLSYPDMKFTRGSRLFKDAMGAEESNAYVQKIDETGLVILGKSNTPEFGLLGVGESLLLGPCRNPWNLDHSSGGSSSGAGAALAARMVPVAQGSDGGGSIRIPAAMCGVFGLKPSRGRFPNQSTPQRGLDISIRSFLSRSVRDTALTLALTELQSGGPNPPVGLVEANKTGRKLNIALSFNGSDDAEPTAEVRAGIEATAELLQSLGHKVTEVPYAKTPYAASKTLTDDFIVLWSSGASSIVDAAIKMHGKNVVLEDFLEPWTLALSEVYRAHRRPKTALDNAIKNLKRMEPTCAQWFEQWDAWLSPVCSTQAPPVGYMAPTLPYETQLERSGYFAAHTALHNVAGTPAMSVPVGYANGLPLAAQLSSAQGNERLLFELAYELEQSINWNAELPDLIK